MLEFRPRFVPLISAILSFPHIDWVKALFIHLFLLGWIATSIPVSTVAKAMLIDAEKYARNKEADPAAITYENSDILALLSAS